MKQKHTMCKKISALSLMSLMLVGLVVVAGGCGKSSAKKSSVQVGAACPVTWDSKKGTSASKREAKSTDSAARRGLREASGSGE